MNDRLDYISYPLPEDIERLVYAGKLEKALQLIEYRLIDFRVPNALKKRLEFEKHIIEALPAEYPYTRAEMLDILKGEVEGFTEAELDELTDDGTLDWIFIEGEQHYKDDCASCLRKTHPELNKRFTNKAAIEEKYNNYKELDRMIADMKRNGHARVRYTIRETITLDSAAERPGARIRVHMPLPVTSGQCKALSVSAPDAAYIAPEDHPQRTVYFEETYKPGMSFTAEFSYEIDAPYTEPESDKVSDDQPDFYTSELEPQIRFTPYIKALVDELCGEEKNQLIKARRFYDYVTANTCYRFVPPYYTKTNIPEYFGAGRRGDCGMHALLFITLCRCAGIPAQWQAGWYAKPGDLGCHDWARFYIAPYGWLYADGSFGGAAFREGHFDRWNFYFGNLDPWRMVSNTDIQVTFDPPCEHLRFDPYDNQSGEVEYDDRMLSHSEFSIKRELLKYEELPDK